MTHIELAPDDTDNRLDSWEPIDLNTLPPKPPIPPTLGGVGLVYPGKRHVFSGPQESAKTLAAYAIGIQVIRAGGTIILIDFEMGGYDARGRLHELGATPHEISRLHYLEPEQPATKQRLERLAALQPDLVIIDAAAGAYDLQGLDDNKRQDAEKIARLYIRGFWKAGIATIFIDHVVKNSETRGKYAIGSERKVGGADVHLGFETITPISRGSNGIYKVITHKDRGGFLQRGTLAELHLESDPETHNITWEFKPVEHVAPGEVWMPTKVMEKVSQALEQQPEPVSRNTVITELGGRKDVAIKAIDHLIRLQYITETAGPRGAKLLESTRPFTVYEWENQPDIPPVPTRSHLFPEQVSSLVPTCSPPYGGTGTSDGAPEQAPVPEWSWIDELAPKDHPPGDLHDHADDLPL